MININRTLFLTILFVASCTCNNAQTIFGKWHSTDDHTGKVDSVVEIYKKKGKAYAKIIEIKNPNPQNAVCEKCEGKNKNKPILGLDILSGLKKDGDEWSGGKILDPRNGKIYKCFIKLVEPNKLKLRGYIGFSLIGKTKYWKRAE